MIKIIMLIVFLFGVNCAYKSYITESNNMDLDPCYKVIKQSSFNNGFKEIFYKDTCLKK